MSDVSNIFIQYLENLMCTYSINCVFNLSREDLTQLAYEFAAQNKINHLFRNKTAGEQWLHNFHKRNPSISLRAPEPTSVARARGFNLPQMQLFFNNLEALMDKNKFSMSRNVDETCGCYKNHTSTLSK